MTVDPLRWEHREKFPRTGIYVRAQVPPDNRWTSVDIEVLDLESLMSWLRSRGGDNKWAGAKGFCESPKKKCAMSRVKTIINPHDKGSP